jgi:hypothetical protein
MAVIVSHAQIQGVKDTLAAVTSNGQAAAAIASSLKAAKNFAKVLRDEGGSYREQAAKDIDTYAGRVAVYQKPMTGNPTMSVDLPTWSKAKEQILNLYMLAFTVESTMPPGVDLGDGWGPALKSALADLPATIGSAAKVVAGVVQTVVKETAKIGGSLLWGIVSGAWPLFAIAGVGLVGFLVIRAKFNKAVTG